MVRRNVCANFDKNLSNASNASKPNCGETQAFLLHQDPTVSACIDENCFENYS
jgi:hypothetical protein